MWPPMIHNILNHIVSIKSELVRALSFFVYWLLALPNHSCRRFRDEFKRKLILILN